MSFKSFYLQNFLLDDSLSEKCRLCLGTGIVTVELGGNEKEESKCINCDGVGSLTCTTCQGNGIQPRYLDRRYGVVLPLEILLLKLPYLKKMIFKCE